ncbi:MAG: chaperone modulatory protein CbpM [Aliidongia sp.]|nr:chaperone modulatory protein CbpM [Aliidongia sp.]
MIPADAVTALFEDLELVELTSWVERSWVVPEPGADGGWLFHAIDVARVRLIYDLRRDMAVAEDTVPLVLSLLDQIYELRAQLKSVARAVDALPETVRAQILAALDAPPGE